MYILSSKSWFALVALFVITAVHGTDYYVDATNGDDSWTGTLPDSVAGPPIDGPWKTLGHVNTVTNGSGNSLFLPGDRILLRRGETWRETLIVPASGDASNPLTIGAYHPTTLTLPRPEISCARDITNFFWEGIFANGGFEDALAGTGCNITGWAVGSNGTFDCAIETEDSQVFRITNTGSNTFTNAKTTKFHMQTGGSYSIEGRVKVGNGAVIRVSLESLQPSREYLGIDGQGQAVWMDGSGGFSHFFSSNASGWTAFSVPFTGILSDSLYIRVSVFNSGGTGWVDDLKIIDNTTNYWTVNTLNVHGSRILIEDGTRLNRGDEWEATEAWHLSASVPNTESNKLARYIPATPAPSGTIEISDRLTGVYLEDKDYVILEDLTVSGCEDITSNSQIEGAGILLTSGSSNNIVRNVLAINNAQGIRVQGKNSSTNEFNENNVFTDFEVAHSVSQGIALRSDTTNNTIQNCVIRDLNMLASDDSAADKEPISIGGNAGNGTGTLIQDCEVYNAGLTNSGSVGIVVFNSPQTTILRNYVHDIGRNGIVVAYLSDDSLVMNNVVRNVGLSPSATKGSGLEMGSSGADLDNVQFINNSVMGCANNNQIYGGITVRGDTVNTVTNAVVRNNIVHGCNSFYPMAYYVANIDFDSLVSDHNLFYRDQPQNGALVLFQGDNYVHPSGSPQYSTWSTFDDYKADSRNQVRALDQNSFFAEPRWLIAPGNDLHLATDSPAIDAGDPVDNFSAEPENNGNRINIGAYGNTAEATAGNDNDADGLTDQNETCFDGDCGTYNPYDPVTNPAGGDLDVNKEDSDSDGYRDGTEVLSGSNPLDANSTPTIVADGDVNLDGQINAADILLAQRSVLNLTMLTAEQIAHGDYRPTPSGDGQLGLADLLLIVKTALSTL